MFAMRRRACSAASVRIDMLLFPYRSMPTMRVARPWRSACLDWLLCMTLANASPVEHIYMGNPAQELELEDTTTTRLGYNKESFKAILRKHVFDC